MLRGTSWPETELEPKELLNVPPQIILIAIVLCALISAAAAAGSIDIDSRLEPFVDDYLIDKLSRAKLILHRATERDVAITLNKPWEGNNCGYVTVFEDDGRYRMYYRGRQLDWKSGKVRFPHKEVYCYAESRDGIKWKRPNLGLIEFGGSKKNNICLEGLGCHAFSPFKDANPACKPSAKYKALGLGKGGLVAFKSPDGLRWSLMRKTPVITKGAFDSQNLAFWDTERGEYRDYHRAFRNGRDIMTCTSKDFLTWTEPVWLKYEPGRITQLYTNQIVPYHRAPHIFLGFPSRYVDSRSLLTPLNEAISRVSKRFGTDYSDTGFITSRDRLRFHVWGEAFIRPGLVQKGRWVYGDNYQNWGVVETKSDLPGTPNELSVYASEGCWSGKSMAFRRYTVRIDGFASVQAPLSGGELFTKPLVFAGQELVINFSTSAAGSVRVELRDPKGKPIPGHTLRDCPEIYGDSIEQAVSWKRGRDVSGLAGKPVRLRFVLKDADLYSIRFR